MTSTVETGIRFALRDYQTDALDRMAAAEARGVRKQLGVAATGLGKTVIFCAYAQRRGGRTLILAHRDELVSQAVKKVQEIWPGVDVGIVKAGENHVHAQVVVASVQTLARQKRLAQLVAAPQSMLHGMVEPLDLVVVDEAHHAEADTYQRIIETLRCGEPDGPLLLGVTATPDRGDGKGLDKTFDEIVWNYDVLWGIRAGFLADVRARRIVLDRLDLSKVKVRQGDYDAGAAGRAMEDASAPEYIVKAWQEHASDRQTIVFTPTVEVARQVADEFTHKGVRAAMVHGGTPLEERRQLLHDYATGVLQVVANCAVLTEGFDEPRTDCIVVARPTKSRALFTQMVGRGTRKHPDKDHLLVLDVVDASVIHSLITVPSLFGIPENDHEFDVTTQNLTDVVDAFEQAQVALGKMRAEDADLFRKLRGQGIAWVKMDRGDGRSRFERSLGYSQDGSYINLPTVVLAQRDRAVEESWACWLRNRDGGVRVLIHDVGQELAQGVGEDYCRKVMGSRTKIINADAKWRTRKPSPRQKDAAKKWRVADIDKFKTAGELSDAIDQKIASVEHARRRRKVAP